MLLENKTAVLKERCHSNKPGLIDAVEFRDKSMRNVEIYSLDKRLNLSSLLFLKSIISVFQSL